MIGFPLDMFTNRLTSVPDHLTSTPNLTVDIAEILGQSRTDLVKERYGDMDIQDIARRLPASVHLKCFTFDQLCKIRYGQIFTMDSSVEKLFEDNPEYSIVRKIQNCMWRWGCGSDVWNEVVEAYDAIRNFSIPVAGFEVRLDFTTHCNERGYSSESRTYLDGVFGFLVYYKGEHVMTLGFSIMAGRRVLVQQVQLTKRKGNRFLFNLPANRLEFFLDCFAKAFPLHTLCIADGGDIGNTSLNSYKNCLENTTEWLNNLLKRPMTPYEEKSKKRYEEEREDLNARIAHLSADLPRLAALYEGTGRFVRNDAFTVNSVRHYPLTA